MIIILGLILFCLIFLLIGHLVVGVVVNDDKENKIDDMEEELRKKEHNIELLSKMVDSSYSKDLKKKEWYIKWIGTFY